MTHTSRLPAVSSPNSAPPPAYSSPELSIRDILEKWAGTDETLRAALNAHSSMSNCHAEEERTRQDYYRLETRRVEYDLLREAFRGGIHPSLIPQLFSSQERPALQQSLSPISPITGHDDRPPYPTSSLPSYNRRDLPRIDTSNILPPSSNRNYLAPSHREKYAGPISAPPASMATSSPPPSIFFRHWAPPPSQPAPPRHEEIGLRTPREDTDRYSHHQIPSPVSARKSPPSHNGISPKRGSASHGRPRADGPGKLHETRHHPYSSRPLQQKRSENEENGAQGEKKSPIDKETLMRALLEKVGPRKEENGPRKQDESPLRDNEKREGEKRRPEGTRDVMALDQLVESNQPSHHV